MTTVTNSATVDDRSRMSKFLDKFKLSSHSEMERFMTITLTFIIVGALIFTLVGIGVYRHSKANIGARAIYTKEFTTSRTQQVGEVLGVYSNKTGTRSVLLYKFGMPDNMSQVAEDYDVHVMGVDAKMKKGSLTTTKATKVSTPMTGEVISFGKSGVMGVVLDSPKPIDVQIINLTIFSKKDVAPINVMIPDVLKDYGYDSSFEAKDGFRVIFNPGGSERTYISALDSNEFDVRNFYNDAVLHTTEQGIRKKLDGGLQKMKSAQDRILSLYDQADALSTTVGDDHNVKLIPPAPPAVIAGDDVTGESAEVLRNELMGTTDGPAIQSLERKSQRARDLDTYADGYMPNTYVLNTRNVVSGGFNYDWRDGSIGDGYLSTIVPAGVDGKQYIDKISLEADSYDASTNKPMLSNGILLSDAQKNIGAVTATSLQQLQTLSNNISAAYSAFYTAKRQYQRVDLQQLLLLEVELDNIVTTTNMSQGRDNVKIKN